MGEERNDGILECGIDEIKLKAIEDARMAEAVYRKMLTYAIEGCRHLIWKTAFDLNKSELSATQVQEIVYNLSQMANDLDSYEAEAERLGIGK